MVEDLAEAFSHLSIQRALLACVLCGTGCSLLSVFVVLMRMPLIGVAMSHAAFAGAVVGMLAGGNPAVWGFIFCLAVAAALGPFSDRLRMTPENVLGIFFSFLMGLAFMGMGILTRTKAAAFALMWGNLLSISLPGIVVLCAVTAAVILFITLFFKEIQAVLFHRQIAAASGVPERLIYYAVLFLTGAVVSANLSTVGGLLIFALLMQPGATAMQLTYDLKLFFVISAASGITACITGLILSYIFDLPSGASIVIMATVLFAAAYVASPKRRSLGRAQRN